MGLRYWGYGGREGQRTEKHLIGVEVLGAILNNQQKNAKL